MSDVKIPTDLREDAADITGRGVVRDPESGEIVSRIGVMLSLFFVDGWTPKRREAMLQIAKDYVALFPGKITHMQYGGYRRYCKFTPEFFSQTQKVLERPKDDEGLFIYMRDYDGKSADSPAMYHIIGFGNSKESSRINNDPLSWMKIHFPPHYVFANPQKFVDLVRKWCNALAPAHGTAGMAVLTDAGNEKQTNYANVPLLFQYPGLDFNAAGLTTLETKRGGFERPRTSNWLTILDTSNVNLLGGVDKVRSELSAGMAAIDFDSGLIIKTGPLPVLGDEANGGIPQGYKTVARIIKPIVYQDYNWAGLFSGLGTENSKRITPQWFNRFD